MHIQETTMLMMHVHISLGVEGERMQTKMVGMIADISPMVWHRMITPPRYIFVGIPVDSCTSQNRMKMRNQ